MTKAEERLVGFLQQGLPVCPRPLAQAGKAAGMTEREALTCLIKWRDSGFLRKIGGFVNHYRLGFIANAMAVWHIAEEKLENAGRRCSAKPYVSHCYVRFACPAWPFQLYTMIHGRSAEEIDRYIGELFGEISPIDYKVLTSKKELKKQGPRFQFSRT